MLSAVEQSRYGCVDIRFIGEAFKMGKIPLILSVQFSYIKLYAKAQDPPSKKINKLLLSGALAC